MAWERRGNGLYYYHKRREGRRVVSEYVGTGLLAEDVAERDAVNREKRRLESRLLHAERNAQREIDQAIDTAADALRDLTHAVLLANGFHEHRRQWRRRRNGDTS